MEESERISKFEERLTKLEASVERLWAVSQADQPLFPEPLAYALGRYGSAGTHHDRFHLLIDAGEIALKYTLSLIAACEPSALPADLFHQPPALGLITAAIKNFVNAANAPSVTDAALLVVVKSLRKDNGKLTAAGRYLLDEFVSIRNKQRGHASSLPDGAYENLWRPVYGPLLDSLNACAYLRFHFVRVESVDLGRGEWFEYRITLLNGPVPRAGSLPVISKDRVRRAAACVWDGALRLISLHPLVTYRVCSICGLEHTFFLERGDDRRLDLHSYAANHRMRIEEPQ